MPSLVTSSSTKKLSSDGRLTSKQIIKLIESERVVHNIPRDAAPASKPTVSKLEKFLNTND